MRELIKKSKVTYYKHRLNKAIDIIKEFQELTNNIEFLDIEGIFELQKNLQDLNYRVNELLEDCEDCED